MTRLALIALTAAALLGGADVGYAQQRDGPHAVTPPMSATHSGRFHRGHRHRVVAAVVFVPVFVGSAYAPYYYATYSPYSSPVYLDQDPPTYVDPQPDGYFYYCQDPAGYYPDVPSCAIGWMLVVP